MKKILIVIAVLLSFDVSYGSFVTKKEKEVTNETSANPNVQRDVEKTEVTEVFPVETKAQKDRAIMETISKMSVKEYETLTGKKMNFIDRITFKAIKTQFARKLAMAENETEGFNFSGFILGFLLGLIGVLGAYIFSKDKNFRKWTWIGWGSFVVIFLIIAAASA